MRFAITVVCTFALVALTLPAAANDDEAFGQFQEILQAIDAGRFEPMQKAIDKTDMRNRVLSAQPIGSEVAQTFDADFWQYIEAGFGANVPADGSNVQIKLVDFAFLDGKGKAAVRFSKPNFEYAYQVFDLRHDSRGRLKVVDWFDTGVGQMLSAEIAEVLMVVMPTRDSTRRTLSVQNPTDVQLFQVTEIYKAARDRQPPRFFEIYDELTDSLKREAFVAKSAVEMAFLMRNPERLVQSMDLFLEVYSEQAGYMLKMSDYYLAIGGYEPAYALLRRFQREFDVNEGALPAKLSALALATGKPDDAETYAIEATTDEPSLELGWWSMLRARATAGDYAGCLEPLTQLEENFGQRLDAAKLRRDKFRSFVGLVQSEEYTEWRVGRP